MTKKAPGNIWAALGPGILFAGAAIGNSHLVQSTRAGAVFGLGLLLVVLFANVLKYPTFRFGPYYSAVTGRSLIEGYRDQGKPVLILFAISEFVVDAIIIAATAITTAAVSIALFDLQVKATHLAIAITIGSALLLKVGGYGFLERVSKAFVALLTICTLIATVIVLPKVPWGSVSFLPQQLDFATLSFMVALMGFMPAAMSLSVLQSLWVVAKSRQSQSMPPVQDVTLDLNIGYIGSALLAVCFVLMGAGVLFSDGIEPAASAGAFADQILSLYSNTLGSWSSYAVGVSVLLVMLTTLLTLLDGMPRMLAASWIVLSDTPENIEKPIDQTRSFFIILGLMVVLSSVVLLFLMSSFTGFIDFVTITSFLVAPLIAILNHVVVCGKTMPVTRRPSALMRAWSALSIVFLSCVSIGYFIVRFFA
nr:Nramp family divalent metal transporter [Hyphomonas sp. Mor2]